MNNGFYILVYMLWLYIVLLAGLYWIEYFQLVLAYRYMIIVLGYSFNGPVNCNYQLDYQSIAFPIRQLQLAIASKAIQLLVICYMSIDTIQLAISNCNSIAIEHMADRPQEIDHQAQSPPATIFFAKSYIEISVSKAIRNYEHKDTYYIDKRLYSIPGNSVLDRSVPYMNRRLDIKTICYKDQLLYGKKLKNFYRKIC